MLIRVTAKFVAESASDLGFGWSKALGDAWLEDWGRRVLSGIKGGSVKTENVLEGLRMSNEHHKEGRCNCWQVTPYRPQTGEAKT